MTAPPRPPAPGAPPPPEPVTALPPRGLRRTLLTQWWRHLVFVHWPVEPRAVAPLLPPGTRPDVLDGVTYVGLVPFRMERLGFGGGPPVPLLGTFGEINVRLYSVDRRGRRGVVFRTLDCTRLLPVAVAQLVFRLPYRWASMRLETDGGEVAWTSRRIGGGASARVRVAVGERIGRPGPLETFLTARWGLHTDWYGRTRYLPNRHPEWPLHRARLLECDEDLVAACGLPRPDGPPASVLYSPGVPVRFGPPLEV
ncbi:YqjF family protein [Streptomyces sp. NPDC001380]|uniref:YqjF family protein n=1 Tax=Streptomyces sp. NPDC001380 TaxID=3364566 RepID=UPI0036D10BF8